MRIQSFSSIVSDLPMFGGEDQTVGIGDFMRQQINPEPLISIGGPMMLPDSQTVAEENSLLETDEPKSPVPLAALTLLFLL